LREARDLQTTLERPLPHSADAERAVLGALLVGNFDAGAALDLLRPEDFFLNPNQVIFSALREMRESASVSDLLLLEDKLNREGKLEAAGGVAYIANLIDGVPRVSNVTHYAAIVRDKAELRELIHLAAGIQDRAFDHESSPADLRDDLANRLSEMAERDAAIRDNGISYRDAGTRLLMELVEQPGPRIFTDVEDVDKLTGGFRPGELVLFTAETGVGKTLLAQQTRRRACRDGYHTLYCSGEMMAQHLIARELATEAAVPHWKMRRSERITPQECQALIQAAAHECTRCRILDGELSLDRIRRVARAMKRTPGLECLVIDYDELVEIRREKSENEFDLQRKLVRAAKSLGMELHCSVLLISQLRKALQGEDRKRPTLERLYGSGAKAKHSSLVIYVDREYVRELAGDETSARIVVVKNRDGKVGSKDVKFNIETLRFESLAQPWDALTSSSDFG
jgi:replicative DNA helicase